MNKFKNRRDKIEFLMGILNGDRHAAELIPQEDMIIVAIPDLDGVMRYTCRGKSLTEEEVRTLEKKYPNWQCINVTYENT